MEEKEERQTYKEEKREGEREKGEKEEKERLGWLMDVSII